MGFWKRRKEKKQQELNERYNAVIHWIPPRPRQVTRVYENVKYDTSSAKILAYEFAELDRQPYWDEVEKEIQHLKYGSFFYGSWLMMGTNGAYFLFEDSRRSDGYGHYYGRSGCLTPLSEREAVTKYHELHGKVVPFIEAFPNVKLKGA